MVVRYNIVNYSRIIKNFASKDPKMNKKRNIVQKIIDRIRLIKVGRGKRYAINIIDDAKAVCNKLYFSQEKDSQQC